MQKTIEDYNEEKVSVKKEILMSLLKRMDFIIKQLEPRRLDNTENE